MNDNDVQFDEDAALASEVRLAFSVGEVPAHLRKAVCSVAHDEWRALRHRRRLRMHAWLSGLTSCAAALVIFVYSAPQYFAGTGASAEDLRRVDRIIDLVSISYPDDNLTDEELEGISVPGDGEKLTAAYVAERFGSLSSFSEDDDE